VFGDPGLQFALELLLRRFVQVMLLEVRNHCVYIGMVLIRGFVRVMLGG